MIEKPSSGEKMMNWVMKHIMPWVIAAGFAFCLVMLVIAVISSV